MTRRCSHCSHNGHNSRTCPNRGVKIFGVRLTDGSIRKSASMGNLSHFAGSSIGAGGGGAGEENGGSAADGYASEDLGQGSSARERKKGVSWTEEEHRMFLIGLQKLGKGDWRGISRNFVVSRTPTQVASHAQKYFIRQTNLTRRKRRSSLFDMVPDETIKGQPFPVGCPEQDKQSNTQLQNAAIDEECESMDSNTHEGETATSQPEVTACNYPAMVFPAYFPPFFPFTWPYWRGYAAESSDKTEYEIVRPTAVHSKTLINVEELVGMSKLSLGECKSEGLSLSLKLGASERQSAFHANPPSSGSSMNSGSNPIHAV